MPKIRDPRPGPRPNQSAAKQRRFLVWRYYAPLAGAVLLQNGGFGLGPGLGSGIFGPGGGTGPKIRDPRSGPRPNPPGGGAERA